MKKLLLLRHAKADRQLGVEDSERPLNPRGRKAAPKMAEAMLTRDYIPDAVLASPSQRTRQTWQLMAPVFGADVPEAKFIDRLYLASAGQILDIARQAEPQAKTLLIVGHNPGLEDIAARLTSEDQSFEGKIALERLARKYPTCSLTVLAFAIENWHELSLGTGSLIAFITPSSLDD